PPFDDIQSQTPGSAPLPPEASNPMPPFPPVPFTSASPPSARTADPEIGKSKPPRTNRAGPLPPVLSTLATENTLGMLRPFRVKGTATCSGDAPEPAPASVASWTTELIRFGADIVNVDAPAATEMLSPAKIERLSKRPFTLLTTVPFAILGEVTALAPR